MAKSIEARLEELEGLAWKLLIHDAADAQREDLDLPIEADQLLDYFEAHGVSAFDVNPAGEPVRARVDPHSVWSFAREEAR